MRIRFKKLNEKAIKPTSGSNEAAGYDLYAVVDDKLNGDAVMLRPGETRLIGTGIAVEIPGGCFGAIFARSGLATKEGLRPANCVGVVDSDYRGEVKVALHNDSSVSRTVTNNERIAQLVIIPFISAEFEEVETLEETNRGGGGFGSTGKL